jgi:hypothetical protein
MRRFPCCPIGSLDTVMLCQSKRRRPVGEIQKHAADCTMKPPAALGDSLPIRIKMQI